MARIEYIASLDRMYQDQGFPPYDWSQFESSPWTPLKRRLKTSRLTLISSAGIFRDDQPPFDPWAVNDLSFREIPVDTPRRRIRLHHNYFDHRDALKDINCVFPVDRLRELAADGVIGELAPAAFTLGMGRLYRRTALQQETVPRLVDRLKGQETDAVLLVPA